jgi:hypothetical protein
MFGKITYIVSYNLGRHRSKAEASWNYSPFIRLKILRHFP